MSGLKVFRGFKGCYEEVGVLETQGAAVRFCYEAAYAAACNPPSFGLPRCATFPLIFEETACGLESQGAGFLTEDLEKMRRCIEVDAAPRLSLGE